MSDVYKPETQTSQTLWNAVLAFPAFPERLDQLDKFKDAYSTYVAEVLIEAEKTGRALDEFSRLACRACDEGEVPPSIRTLIAIEATRV